MTTTSAEQKLKEMIAKHQYELEGLPLSDPNDTPIQERFHSDYIGYHLSHISQLEEVLSALQQDRTQHTDFLQANLEQGAFALGYSVEKDSKLFDLFDAVLKHLQKMEK